MKKITKKVRTFTIFFLIVFFMIVGNVFFKYQLVNIVFADSSSNPPHKKRKAVRIPKEKNKSLIEKPSSVIKYDKAFIVHAKTWALKVRKVPGVSEVNTIKGCTRITSQNKRPNCFVKGEKSSANYDKMIVYGEQNNTCGGVSTKWYLVKVSNKDCNGWISSKYVEKDDSSQTEADYEPIERCSARGCTDGMTGLIDIGDWIRPPTSETPPIEDSPISPPHSSQNDTCNGFCCSPIGRSSDGGKFTSNQLIVNSGYWKRRNCRNGGTKRHLGIDIHISQEQKIYPLFLGEQKITLYNRRTSSCDNPNNRCIGERKKRGNLNYNRSWIEKSKGDCKHNSKHLTRRDRLRRNPCGGYYGFYVDLCKNISGKEICVKYTHLHKLGPKITKAINEGQETVNLNSSDIVAYGNSTGSSTGNHLHLEMYQVKPNDRVQKGCNKYSSNRFTFNPLTYCREGKIVENK